MQVSENEIIQEPTHINFYPIDYSIQFRIEAQLISAIPISFPCLQIN